MKCSKCWNKDNLTFIEYLGAYDWILTYKCKCWTETHKATWYEVLEVEQVNYWPAYFKLKDEKGHSVKYKNQFKI